MKINPAALRRPNIVVISREFTDDAQPEHVLSLSVQRLDFVTEGLVSSLASDRCRMYIDGNWIDETGEMNKAPLPPTIIDGQPVILSRSTIYALTMLEQMQAGPHGDRYNFDELVNLAVCMPKAIAEACDWCSEVQSNRNSAKKKDDGKTFASEPSDTDNSIPTSSTD